MATIDQAEDTFAGRAREGVSGWWGRSRRFLAEVRNEMGRVTWPNQKEVYATTIVVIIFSVAVGVYLWLCDLVLSRGIGWIYHLFGAS